MAVEWLTIDAFMCDWSLEREGRITKEERALVGQRKIWRTFGPLAPSEPGK